MVKSVRFWVLWVAVLGKRPANSPLTGIRLLR